MCWFTLLIVLPALASADEKPAQMVQKANELFMGRKYDEALKLLDAAVKKDPKLAQAYQERACTRFMKSDFKGACADFDHFIKLAPLAYNANWQRGIALYYVGRYADGRDQFKGYEKRANNDVENTFWHFMCVSKLDGVKKARESLLKTSPDTRVPMNKVLELLQGKAKPEDVLKAANDAPEGKRKSALFYAHLYLGLYHDVTGDRKKAVEHLGKAAGEYHDKRYMGEVARVHLEWLKSKK